LDEDEQESYFFYVLQTEYPYSLLGENSLWKLTPPEINDLMKGLKAEQTLREKRQEAQGNFSKKHKGKTSPSKSDLKAAEKFMDS
jgi:hypothetical protein